MTSAVQPVMTALNSNPHQSACADCIRQADCIVGLASNSDASDAPSVTRQIFHAGDTVFEQGDCADSVIYIASGTVKEQITDAAGDRQVVGFAGSGATLGLVQDCRGHHGTTATALGTVAACKIKRLALLRSFAHSPIELDRLLAIPAEQSEAQARQLHLVGQKNAEQRMAAFLVAALDRQRQAMQRTDRVELPMSRADLGSYLTLAVETVSRLLTRLQDAGYVKVERHGVEIVDESGLRALTGAPDDLGQRGAA